MVRHLRPLHLFAACLALPLACLTACYEKKAPPAPPPPPEVQVIVTSGRDVPIVREWIATTDGMVNAKVRAQVSGYLTRQLYQEGNIVKKGEVLFEIDDRPFRAAVDQARGDLAQAQAKLEKATIDVNRYTPLAAENAISQQELDDAVQAKAAAEAAVAASRAVVEQAEYSLGFTKITSLIDGVAGIANAQIGDLVGPSGADLTAVSTLDPIKVYFVVSEQEYMDWVAQYPTDAERVKRESTLEFELILANGDVWPHKGKFQFADRQVDVRTGTLRLIAAFPNPANVLKPGQFGRVRTIVKVAEGVILVPQRAVIEVQGTYMVAVVEEGNKVAIKPVKVGERIGSDWIIKSGLEEGETVIVEGQQKSRPGTVVNPKPFVDPAAAKPKPKPKAKPAEPSPTAPPPPPPPPAPEKAGGGR